MNKKITFKSGSKLPAPASKDSPLRKPFLNHSMRKGLDIVKDSETMHIVSIVFNQPHLIHTLNESISATCTKPWKLHIVDNGSSEKYIEPIREACKQMKIVHHERTSPYTMSRASQAHGDALDYAIKNICEDKDLMLIVDSDFFFVKKGWDAMLRGMLPISGHISTVRHHTMHTPAAFMSLFRKRTIKNKRISFMPMIHKGGKAIAGKDVGHELAKIPNFKWIKLSNMPHGAMGSISPVEGTYNIGLGVNFLASHLSRGRLYGRNSERMEKWLEDCRKYAK